MAEDRIYIEQLTVEEQAVLDRLVKQLGDRAEQNLKRVEYYDYKRRLQRISPIIPPLYERLGIVLGWSAKAVDVLARRCNLDGFVWDEGELDDLGYTELLEGNQLGTEMSSGMISSLIHGVSFLVNTKGQDGEPSALIHVKDALNGTGTWNGRTRALDDFLSVHDRDDRGKPKSFALYLRNRTVTADQDERGVWRVDRTDHPWGVPVEPLVYKPRAGRPMGTARISRAVMALQDMATRTVIRMEAHMDIYSIPELWLLGADESIFQNDDGTKKDVLRIVMGRLKAIPDDDEAENPRADVKQFSAQSPEPHLLALKQQAQLFSGETSIPLASLGVSDMANPTSADSYIASREDLIAEAEGATDDWSPPMRRTLQRALAMANDLSAIPDEWATMAPKWRSPIYLSRAAQADAGAKQIGAVPWLAETSVGLELLGLDPTQQASALADRRRVTGSQALQAIVQAAQNPTPVVAGALNPPPVEDAEG